MNLREAFSGNDLTLIGYLPAGYPDAEKFREGVKELAQFGFKVLEFGIPFDSPSLDGEVIEKAIKGLSKKGLDPFSAIRLAGEAAREFKLTAVGMFYYSQFMEMGKEKCVNSLLESGVGALLVPDVPDSELEDYSTFLMERGVDPVGFVPLNAEDWRIGQKVKFAAGFIYCQSRIGKTGERFLASSELRAKISLVKELATPKALPIAVGFGLRTKSDLDEVRSMGADAAAIGTVLVQAAGKGRKYLTRLLTSLTGKD